MISRRGAHLQGGIIIEREKSVPSHKMTNFSTSQNIIEKALGIKKINIHTAGMGAITPEISFEGLVDSREPKRLLSNIIEGSNKSRDE